MTSAAALARAVYALARLASDTGERLSVVSVLLRRARDLDALVAEPAEGEAF